MLIDWFTVGAQALNFLILVWLMKRFLYKPILAAVDAREKRIAGELADADAKRAEAARDRDEFRGKSAEIDRQRTALLTAAQVEAQALRQRLLDEARTAADTLTTARQDALRNQAKALDQALSQRIQQEVFAIARKTLHDLAGVDLEDRLVALFTSRLHDLDGPSKASLGTALTMSTEPVLLRSAVVLPPAQVAAIQTALNRTFSADIPLRFATAPDLIAGIELTAHGQKMSWSIAGYLATLETSINDLLHAQDQAGSQNGAKPTASAAAKLQEKPATTPTVTPAAPTAQPLPLPPPQSQPA